MATASKWHRDVRERPAKPDPIGAEGCPFRTRGTFVFRQAALRRDPILDPLEEGAQASSPRHATAGERLISPAPPTASTCGSARCPGAALCAVCPVSAGVRTSIPTLLAQSGGGGQGAAAQRAAELATARTRRVAQSARHARPAPVHPGRRCDLRGALS
eukprot:scaffold11724_cov124-Isochrysis_galbana.AAC.13